MAISVVQLPFPFCQCILEWLFATVSPLCRRFGI